MDDKSFYLSVPCPAPDVSLIAVLFSQCNEKQPDDVEFMLSRKLVQGEYSIFRGIKGKGFVCIGEHSIELSRDDILLVNTHDVTAAVPASGEWNFMQYRFTCPGGISFLQKNKKYTAAYKKQEEFIVREMFCHKYSEAEYSSALISSLFAFQMMNWAMELDAAVRENSMYSQKIHFAIEYMNLHLEEPLSISELSSRFSISERHFRHMFREVTGLSPKAYLQQLRLTKAAQMLTQTEMTVQEIADSMGYYSQYQLSRDFKKHFGMSPTDYRRTE